MIRAFLVNESLIVNLSESIVEIVYAIAEKNLRIERVVLRIGSVHPVGVNDVSGSPVEEYVLPVEIRQRFYQEVSHIGIRRIMEIYSYFSRGGIQ